jgi:ABC-2 type transport system permease protein
LVHVVLKDLRLATRPRTTVAALAFLPLVVILVVVGVEGGDRPRILLPVVNYDHGPAADTLCRVLGEHADVRQVDRATAERLVATDNDAAAALIVPPDFSRHVAAQQSSTIELLTDPAEWKDLAAIRILLVLAERKLGSADDPFATELLELRERSLTTKQESLPRLEQRVPGLAVTFVLLNVVLSVAFAVHDEKAHGISGRLAVAPVSRAVLLAGRAIASVAVGTAQLLLLLLAGHVAYGLSLGDSPAAMVLVALCSVFAMAGFALAVAYTARSREQVIPIGLAAVFAVAMIGGCWWPAFQLPPWLQVVNRGTMTSWSMAAMQDVIIRNRTLLGVTPKLLGLVGQGLLWSAVALLLVQVSREPRRA